MTPGGLALGMKALGRRTRLVNIAPIRWSEARAVDIARIANGSAERLGLDVTVDAAEIDNHDEYIGERYGLVTDGGREALQLLARTEAVILDPVYSSKAMAGLIDHVRQGRIGKGETRGLRPHRRHARALRLRPGSRPRLSPAHGAARPRHRALARDQQLRRARRPTSPRSRPISWSGARPWPTAFAGTNTEIGGMIAAAAAHGLEP